jgi:prepilin-type N-terminal cleavage/methylation domain-containing protein
MRSRKEQRGFTMLEVITVVVIVGVLSTYVAVRAESGTYSLSSQASALARDLRHAQALSHTWGRRLRVNVSSGTNGSYYVSCVTAGPAPCNGAPVINPITGLPLPPPVLDPASGQPFNGVVQRNVVLAGPTALDFDSSGKPSGAACYSLSVPSSSNVKIVSISSITGFVAVSDQLGGCQ